MNEIYCLVVWSKIVEIFVVLTSEISVEYTVT